MKITKRRVTKRNRIKRKYSKKRTKTRHSRKRVFSKKRRKTIKKKKRGGMSFNLFRKKEPVISEKEKLKDERERKKEVQREKKRQKESDLENKKRKENEIEKNLKEIEKLSIDKENVDDKIDKLKNNYEMVLEIVEKKDIQTIEDFESNFVKEKILNFINNNGDKIRLKLHLIKEAEKRIKESGKKEGGETSATKGGLPITHIKNYQNEYPNYKPGVPSYSKNFQYDPNYTDEPNYTKKGNEPSKNYYDVEQDKKDLTEYKNDYFTIMLKIKEIFNPSSIIEKEIENIKNKNEKIKDDINKIDKKYNIK
jgi:hypothetical protein